MVGSGSHCLMIDIIQLYLFVPKKIASKRPADVVLSFNQRSNCIAVWMWVD